MQLSFREQKVRKLLIRVAKGEKGEPTAKRKGRISYKEVWTYLYPNSTWGQAHTREVVELITRISAFEMQNGRPPLNEVVTPTNKLTPTESWGNAKIGIKAYLKDISGISLPYKDHTEAQEACWRYWANHSDSEVFGGEIRLTETQVEEGYREDREVRFLSRNKKIIADAKKRDNFKCRACGFFLEVDGKPIIDCHHTIPLSHASGVRVTRLRDLVCLCPTCHRVAHTRAYPLSIDEIRKRRGL
ncbi:HNH endonuclease [Trinickia sp. NRRL B-1857]|uniref:HNH endonuclease n=1 Tax=Trinickia sp. NRRL B-1857 TaxID=3162879 RepID=UPI003D2E2D15